jgi:hypothetical protein
MRRARGVLIHGTTAEKSTATNRHRPPGSGEYKHVTTLTVSIVINDASLHATYK